MELSALVQQIVNGIALGSLYGLIAIGYTMVYGILRLINFAHGDVMMVGCYIAFYGILIFALPWWGSFLIAIGLTSALGILIDLGAYRPVRNAPRISALITAIGVFLFFGECRTRSLRGPSESLLSPGFFFQGAGDRRFATHGFESLDAHIHSRFAGLHPYRYLQD